MSNDRAEAAPAADAEPAPTPRDRVLMSIRADAALLRDELVARVRAVQDELLGIFAAGPGDERARYHEGADWSMSDLARHVIDVAERIAAQIGALGAGQTPPPYNVPDGMEMQVEDGGETLEQWCSRLGGAHASVLAAIDGLPQEPDLAVTSGHDYFGQFTALEWAGFQRFHILITLDYARQLLETADTRR